MWSIFLDEFVFNQRTTLTDTKQTRSQKVFQQRRTGWYPELLEKNNCAQRDQTVGNLGREPAQGSVNHKSFSSQINFLG